MSFENPSAYKKNTSSETAKLTHGFQELHQSNHVEAALFENLEHDLSQENFTLASNVELSEIFNTQTLLCRSESFTRALDLLLEKKSITLRNKGIANMCTLSSGTGFRTAMQEGFSGKDVEGMVKVVLTFRGEHLADHAPIALDNPLWELKPKTAQVSLVGGGDIEFDDVEMISFRFPVHYYPENLLSETERESLEEDHIKFIVRHYIPNKKRTLH